MVLTSAADPLYVRWRNELARSGCLVIGVEFRNAAGRLGDHPFPAGLNDCASALQWANAKQTALGVSNLLISGESGGGNLALATVLKAKYDGWIEQIDGVFALCPDISCKYLDAEPQLLSLKENEGYIVDTSYLGPLLSIRRHHNSNNYNVMLYHEFYPCALFYILFLLVATLLFLIPFLTKFSCKYLSFINPNFNSNYSVCCKSFSFSIIYVSS